MLKHNFVMIRYSVLSKNKSWKINKTSSFEDYKNNLFEKTRLEHREQLFKEITLPSLANLDDAVTTVLVFVAEEMPGEYYNRLASLISAYKHIKLVKLNYQDSINVQMGKVVKKILEKMPGEIIYSTIRLDDDDALSKNYSKLLGDYLNSRFVGYCISFSSGVGAIVKNGKIDELCLMSLPKTAIGLAWINVFNSEDGSFKFKEISMYELGNHMEIDQKVPTVIDPRELAWIRTVHEGSDFYSEKMLDKYKTFPKVEIESLRENFQFYD